MKITPKTMLGYGLVASFIVALGAFIARNLLRSIAPLRTLPWQGVKVSWVCESISVTGTK